MLKHLCRVESILARFQESAKRHQLFAAGDKLVVGLSGGCDSMVLTHLLVHSGITVVAAHVNYHLRGSESDGDEKLVREWCWSMNITLEVFHANMESEKGIQESARKVRYEWFRTLLQKHHARAIAVAHHMNDQAETVLHHLARGTGMKGAAGMAFINDDVIRPMLEFCRDEIELEARNSGIPFRNDSSNQKEVYTRNLIRHKVIPNLEIVNPQSVRHISEYAALSGQYAAAAEMWCTDWISKNVSTDGTTRVVHTETLLKCGAPDVVLHFLIGSAYNQDLATEIRKLLSSTTGKHIVTDQWNIILDRGYLRIAPAGNPEFRTEVTQIPNAVHGLRLEYGHIPGSFPKGEKDTIWIDLKKVSFPIVVRNWTEGDRIQPMGMTGHQKVSDVLTQAHIPADQKHLVPIVEMNGEVIWVAGIKVSASLTTDGSQAECIVIKLEHNRLNSV